MRCSMSAFSTRRPVPRLPSPFREQRTQGITTYPVTAPGEKGDGMSERKERPSSFEIWKCPEMGTGSHGGWGGRLLCYEV